MRRSWVKAATALAALTVVALLTPLATDGGNQARTSSTALAAATVEPEAYRLFHADASVETFGDVTLGDLAAPGIGDEIVGGFNTLTGAGTVLVNSGGGVLAFGDATYVGGPNTVPLNAPIVGIAGAPRGGYWVVSSDGGVFSYGNAGFFGSAGALPLNQPIVGVTGTPSGLGYWLVAADGGVFSFGDASFFGSTGAITLNSPIVGIESTPSGAGYWIVAADGGVFAFGDAGFFGSTGAITLNSPIVGLASTKEGNGYWLAAGDGGIFAFGDAPFLGRGKNPEADIRVAGIASVPKRFVDIQVLGINDFHGNLEPPGGAIGGVNVGGAVYLSTQLKQHRVGHTNTITVSAGDNIGASPLLSALFLDEPTIEALNVIGVDLSSVGNHEFDKGSDALLRMQNGGCLPAPSTSCANGTGTFAGAKFQYLSANVTVHATGKTLFPAYSVKTFQGARVAFIGMTLEGTPQIVTPAGVAGLDFADEAQTVNALVPQLKAQGIESIVVIVHEGGLQGGGTFNTCQSFTGDIAPIVAALDPAVDVVVSGHTHQAYNCTLSGKLVTQASSFGRVFSDINVTVDRTTGDITAKDATNFLTTRDVTPDPAIQAIITKYQPLVAPIASRVVGRLSAPILRTPNSPTGEWALGNFIADSQLAATAAPANGSAVVALMNPGGIRTDLPPSGTLPPSGDITYNDIFTVQPFGNSLVTMTLTGAQLKAVLEQQIFTVPAGAVTPTRILQVSSTLSYTWSTSAATGSKVTNLMISGVPVDPATNYRVTVNSFLATGGDGFTVLNQGTDRLGGDIDTDAVEKYLVSLNSPPTAIDPPALGRITNIP